MTAPICDLLHVPRSREACGASRDRDEPDRARTADACAFGGLLVGPALADDEIRYRLGSELRYFSRRGSEVAPDFYGTHQRAGQPLPRGVAELAATA